MGEVKRQDVLRQLYDIAFTDRNDAVRLVFSKGQPQFRGKDLRAVTEIKRQPNGAIEIKTMDRIRVAEVLLREMKEEEKRESGAEKLYRAMMAGESIERGEETCL